MEYRNLTTFSLGLAAGILVVSVAAQPLEKERLEALSLAQAAQSWGSFREALSLPNDAHFPEQVEHNVQWARQAFIRRGFDVQALPTGGPPLLLAKRDAAGSNRTVLIYLQLDGQPVDPSQWSQPDPFRPVLKERTGDAWVEIPWERIEDTPDPEWRIFARSAADAKGPVLMFLTALDVMETAALPQLYDIKVVMDFEEELGSPHLPPAVERHRDALAADVLLIFDGPRHLSNRPTLSFGARGIATIRLTVFGPRSPAHSGHYGNYAPNPALRLAQLLGSMKDESGRVTLPGFYDGVVLDEATRAILSDTPDDESDIRTKLGIAASDAVADTYQAALQYPSLNIRGLSAGWVGDQVRTIIPATATAEIDVRLVPESDPDRLIAAIRLHVQDAGYVILDGREPNEEERATHPRLASMTHEISYQSFRTPYDSEAGRWTSRALERAFGEAPVRIRMMGGSIPISPFVVKLGIPAVGVPAVNPDNNQHSPDENLRIGNYLDGVTTYLALLTEPLSGL